MESLYAQKSTAIAFAACWLVAVILVWGFHRQWWRVRAVSRAAWIVPIIALACIVAWGASVRSGAFAPTVVFAVISGFAAAAALGLVVVLPFSGAALTLERFVAWLRARTSRRNAAPGTSTIARIASGDPRSGVSDTSSAHRRASIEEPVRVAELASAADVDERRRSILTLAAAALPALAIGAAGAGVAGSYGRTRFPIVPLYYRDLPGALEGLRILHLSDIHLGYFVALDDLERTLLGAESHRADLVLVTGDVSDNLLILGDALRMIAHLEPRLGIYASVGNHEYYRGIEKVLRTFDAGPIPMMIDASTSIAVGDATIHLSAADDPARTGRFNDDAFLRRSVERAIDAMPSDAFSILMSHRPEGFDVASRHGVDLTLSGHYHGGIQVGWNGRAIIQGLMPNKHYWGHYRSGDAQLYTSGGIGHWFPFRLNCPPEAPVYVLRREEPRG